MSGTVVSTSGHSSYGKTVVIKDANGNLHRFAHMDDVSVKVGQKVSAGAAVGKSGNTGRSTGAHLHYEVTNSKGTPIDPMKYINGGGGGKSFDTTSSGGYNGNLRMYGKQPSSFNSHMNAAIQKGVPSSEAKLLTELIGRESSWNPSAKNPKSSAHGYGQFLTATRNQYEKKTGLSYSNPVNQIYMTWLYVKDRYGSAAKALQFWDKNKWY